MDQGDLEVLEDLAGVLEVQEDLAGVLDRGGRDGVQDLAAPVGVLVSGLDLGGSSAGLRTVYAI